MKEISINKVNDELIVDVKLTARSLASDPMINITTTNIISHLKEENIAFTKVKKETKLNNYSQNSILEGQWIFKLPVKKPKKVAKPKTTTTRSRSATTKVATTEEARQLLGTENMERVPT